MSSMPVVAEPIPMAVLAREADSRVKAALSRHRTATDNSITTAADLARESARASSASSPKMKAVRPGEPIPKSDVTERFEAIRANVR